MKFVVNVNCNVQAQHNSVAIHPTAAASISLRGCWQQLQKQSTQLWLGQGLALLGALLAVPIPLLMPLLVDEVLLKQPGQLTHWVQWLLPTPWMGPVAVIVTVTLLTMTLRLFSVLTGVATTRIFVNLSKHVSLQVRTQLLDKLARIRMQVYEQLGAGQITARLLTDIETLDKFLGETIARVIVSVLSVLGVAAILLWIHWQLALIILCINPFVVALTMRMGKHVKAWKQRENTAFEVLSQLVNETLEVMQQLRASNSDQRFLDKAKQAAMELRAAATASGWKSDALSRLSFSVFLFGFEIFRAVAMMMVVFSDLSVGQMIAVFGYLWFMMGPVQELLSVQVSYFAAKAAISRINQVLAAEEEPQYPAQVQGFHAAQPATIRLDHVTFTYAEGEAILDDVSLQIAAGEQVALVGVSGAGKSTLVQLLLGLYTPQQGRILFNEQAIETLGYAQVREHIGVVLQQPMLFNDSLRQNLTLDRDHADSALWQVLEVAQLAQFVRDLPAGLHTHVGRSGIRLSGGQRQRLAIARMMLQQPQVVILDEATSMLDTHTEALLHQAMRQFLQGRTTITIAHRLSAIKEASRVLVFDQGSIIEEGVHGDLVAQAGSVYQRLYGKQVV